MKGGYFRLADHTFTMPFLTGHHGVAIVVASFIWPEKVHSTAPDCAPVE